MRFDQLKRREFITLLGVGWPLAASAQPSQVRPLIGVLSPLSAAAATRNIAAFRSGLRDLGYVEGRNATLELRYGDGAAERMAPLVGELVALKPDVLFAGSKSGALAAHGATRTIPIVTITPENLVALDLRAPLQGPAATSPEHGSSATMRWSANGSIFSSLRCRASRASGSSPIRTIQPTPSWVRNCRRSLGPWVWASRCSRFAT